MKFNSKTGKFVFDDVEQPNEVDEKVSTEADIKDSKLSFSESNMLQTAQVLVSEGEVASLSNLIKLGKACLICGEPVVIEDIRVSAVVCEKCRNAILRIREEMEDGNEESFHFGGFIVGCLIGIIILLLLTR